MSVTKQRLHLAEFLLNIRCAKYNRDQFHLAEHRRKQRPHESGSETWYPLPQMQRAFDVHWLGLVREFLCLYHPEEVLPWRFTPRGDAPAVSHQRVEAWAMVRKLFARLQWEPLVRKKAEVALHALHVPPQAAASSAQPLIEFSRADLHRRLPDGRALALLHSGYIMWIHFQSRPRETWIFAEVHASMRTATPHFVLIHLTGLEGNEFVEGRSSMQNDCGCEQG